MSKHNPLVANVFLAVKDRRPPRCRKVLRRRSAAVSTRILMTASLFANTSAGHHKRKRQKSESSAESSDLSSLDDEKSDRGVPPRLHQEDNRGAARAKRLMAYAESYRGYSSGIKLHFHQWVVAQDLVAVSLPSYQAIT
jgi:hypothetical protein